MPKPPKKPKAPTNALERAFEQRFADRVGPDVPKHRRVGAKFHTPWALGPHAIEQAQRLADALGITLTECLERQAAAFLQMDELPAEQTYREATRNGR